MKNAKKPKLLITALCLAVAGVFVGVGCRMGADGYDAGWIFMLLGVLFSACLGVLGYAVIRNIRGDDKAKNGKGADITAPPSKSASDDGLQHLHAYGLQISEEDYQKLCRKLREENDTNGK